MGRMVKLELLERLEIKVQQELQVSRDHKEIMVKLVSLEIQVHQATKVPLVQQVITGQ